MANLANRPQSFSSRLQRTYRLELGGKSLLVLLGMMGLTGLVLFYMGVVTGKGMRRPEIADQSKPPAGQQELAAKLTEEPGSLAFNQALLSDKPVVEDLLQNQQKATEQTKDILARAQRELTAEPVPMTPAGTAAPTATREEGTAVAPARATTREGNAPAAPDRPAAARSANPPVPAHPGKESAGEARSNPAPGEAQFTVQVFSSQSEASARALMARLSKLGFAPYLNRFQDSGKSTWYRVRVGKGSRADAERLKARLQKEGNLSNPTVLQL